MSRIYFHSVDETVEVYGSERLLFAGFCNRLFCSLFSDFLDDKKLRKILPDEYIRQHDKWRLEDLLLIWVSGSADSRDVVINGIKEELFSCVLNTALVIGNDCIKFMARVHGQCEIFAYIEKENFSWLREIIGRGVDRGLFSRDVGWDAVMALLLRAKSPIVMSYSVCEQFPCEGLCIEEGTWVAPTEEAWDNLSIEEQWAVALPALRKRNKTLIELSPINWESFYFGNNISAIDILGEIEKSSH